MQRVIRHLPVDFSLCLIANAPSFSDGRDFLNRVEAAVRGGVTCVQLRDDSGDFSDILEMSFRIKKMLKGKGVPFFINADQLTIKAAHIVGAEGVYLEEDISCADVRRVLGEECIIGVPATRWSYEADYASVKVAPSKQTCPRNDDVLGMEGLRRIQATVTRVLAVGGINLENIESIYQELYINNGVALAGGIMNSSDPYETARQMRTIQREVRARGEADDNDL